MLLPEALAALAGGATQWKSSPNHGPKLEEIKVLRDMRAAGALPAIAAGALAAVPIGLTTFPPMVDLPQYAALVQIFNQLAAGGWAYADLFDVSLFTPYLSAFFLIWLFEPITGMVAATKLVVGLAMFGLPVSAAILVKEFGGDTRWPWLVVPASYGFAFNWGFLNFLVAAPLGMLYLVAVSRYAGKPTLRLGLMLAVLTHLLFFAHILPLFFFGALGGVLILMRAQTLSRGFAALLPLLSLAPLGLSWGLPSLGNELGQWPTIWDLRWSRALDIPGLVLGMPTKWGLDFLFLGLLVIPLLGGARPTRQLARYVPITLCILVLMLVPNLLAGTYFTYHRFAIFAIPLYLLILDAPPPEPESSIGSSPNWVRCPWRSPGSDGCRCASMDTSGKAKTSARLWPKWSRISGSSQWCFCEIANSVSRLSIFIIQCGIKRSAGEWLISILHLSRANLFIIVKADCRLRTQTSSGNPTGSGGRTIRALDIDTCSYGREREPMPRH